MFLYLFSPKDPFGGYNESTLYYFHIMPEGNGARVVKILSNNLGSLLFLETSRVKHSDKADNCMTRTDILGYQKLIF